ncbi:FxsA family protein [Litoribrevibacter albus]|uniref:Membrane protein FxsA n=1 Tax=Litoribrevibacter albus TaxID=1473156 RepID=A0AA37S748_9GAMM|nr:FxsA family protein [Litoribrevibacter albus]GLQ29709.1 membrane protein FxsA [Litoribrevibacter albus]
MRWLFLLFCTLPVIELIILLKVGSWLGVWPTVGLILGTAFIGVNLLRQQGLKTFSRANQRLAQGEMPATEMVEGIVLAIGGALLLTPGLVTDVIGFSCLLPGTRHVYIAFGMERMKVVATRSVYTSSVHTQGDFMNQGGFQQPHRSQHTQSTNASRQGHDVIEGEFERKK